jgi:hypothetical protein
MHLYLLEKEYTSEYKQNGLFSLSCCSYKMTLGKQSNYIKIPYERKGHRSGVHRFPKNPGATPNYTCQRVPWSKFCTKDLQVLGVTIKIHLLHQPGAWDLYTPGLSDWSLGCRDKCRGCCCLCFWDNILQPWRRSSTPGRGSKTEARRGRASAWGGGPSQAGGSEVSIAGNPD